jgi:tetratricopeptide (TPR) repeat protein
MHKSATLGLLVACGVAVSVWLAVRARHAEEAHALLERAERLMSPPPSEAASFRDLRAREARQLCDEAQELSPSPEAKLLQIEARGVELFQRGDYTRAAELLAYEQANARTPRLLQLSAAIALAQNDARAAEGWLDRLPDAERARPEALLLRSDAERALGHGDAALAAAERGIAANPEHAALYERRGLAHEMLGQLPAARADLQRASQLDRHGTSALLALGRLLRTEHQLQDAVLAFHEASQRNPDEAEAWLGSGVCRAAMGDNIAARIELERAVELAKTRAEPLIALADLDVAEQDLASALRRYRAALQLDPASALARVKLGNALMRAGAVPEAIPVFRTAIAKQPDLAAAHNGLGAALIASNDLEQAETELKTATRLDPQDPHPWLNLARLYKRRGDESSMSDAVSHAQQRDPQLVAAIHP